MSAPVLLFHNQGEGRPVARMSYTNRILATDPLALWVLGEALGSVVIDSANGYHGTYVGGPTLGCSGLGGRTSAYFNGTGTYANIYSPSLATDFGYLCGSLMFWVKPKLASVWSDGRAYVPVDFFADDPNATYIYKAFSGNLLYLYNAQDHFKYIIYPVSGSDWVYLGLTWDAGNDKVKFYFNGKQVSTTQTNIGIWTPPLSATATCIGSQNTTPINVWNGWIQYVGIWNHVLTSEQIYDLYGVT